MRDLQEILDEVHVDCANNNCQSWNAIAIISMLKAVEEFRCEIIDELTQISNSYSSIELPNMYINVIEKNIIDKYIENIETKFIS